MTEKVKSTTIANSYLRFTLLKRGYIFHVPLPIVLYSDVGARGRQLLVVVSGHAAAAH